MFTKVGGFWDNVFTRALRPRRYTEPMTELVFEVRDAEEGGFWARALGESIFTQAETWDELKSNVLEAVGVHFDPGTAPRIVQLHYVRDELLTVGAA